MAAVRASGLVKRFETTVAVDHVDLAVRDGEVRGLLGPNLPLMAGVLAGDMFAAGDRYGTWKTVLTRSCTRRHVFVGKLLAVALFALGLLALLALSSLAAGVLLVGAHPLVSLSGTAFSSGQSLLLVALAWLVCALPMLAFTSLAVLLSVATRNGIAGVLGPAVVDLAM